MKNEVDKHECCTECGKNSVFRWYRVTAAHIPRDNRFWRCSACAQVEEDIQVRRSVSFRKLKEKL